MALQEGKDYRVIPFWACPHCKTPYFNVTVGIVDRDRRPYGPFHETSLFCKQGCARYFTPEGDDVTYQVERDALT